MNGNNKDTTQNLARPEHYRYTSGMDLSLVKVHGYILSGWICLSLYCLKNPHFGFRGRFKLNFDFSMHDQAR